MNNSEIRQALITTREVLDGKLDILSGCRRLAYELVCADLHDDPSYPVFNGVSSECDHLPLGRDRQHWNTEVLKKKDEEIAGLTVFYRDEVLKACQDLFDRRG